MVVTPRSAHTFRVDMVRNDTVVIGEQGVAERASSILFSDFPIEQLAHLRV